MRFRIFRLMLVLGIVSGWLHIARNAPVVYAATPEYAFPCKVNQNGNWKIVRDKRSFTDQQLIDDININGLRSHGGTGYAIDLSNYPGHLGTDIRTYGICEDLTVLAARSGTVAFNGWHGEFGGGNTIIVNHNDGQYSYYNHLETRYNISVGTSIGEGTPLGVMGKTGNATGVHLHFDIRPNAVFGSRLTNWKFKSPVNLRTYRGEYISQNYQPTMLAGSTQTAEIRLKNIGTATWDGNTKLVPIPQDKESPFYDSATWQAPHRIMSTGTVEPEHVKTLNFVLRAPSTPGQYRVSFGFVQEGVTWFTQPGQGQIYFDINVSPTIGANSTRPQMFVDAYNRSGGSAAWGYPTSVADWWGSGANEVVIQNFSGGLAGDTAIIHDEQRDQPENTVPAYVIHGGIWQYYRDIGGADSWLGPLTSDEFENGNGQAQSNFANGYIAWNGGNPVADRWPAPNGTWRAEYHNGRNLNAHPTWVQNEPTINHLWGETAPGDGRWGVWADNFSARWTTRQNFTAGTYTFIAEVDDGVRVWVDNKLIIDKWIDQAFTEYRQDVVLTEGEHDLKVEYYQGYSFAGFSFRWEKAAPPQAPDNVNIAVTTNTSIKLAWEDNSNDEKGFRIYMFDGSDWSVRATVEPNITSFTDTGLACSVSRSYMVSAFNDNGESVRAGPVDGRTENCPEDNQPPNIPVPTEPVHNSVVGSREVTLTWDDGGDPDERPRSSRQFSVDIMKEDGSWTDTLAWQSNTEWTVTVPADGIYSWKVKASDGEDESDWTAPRFFTVDTVFPTASITAPLEGSVITDSLVIISANAADNPGGSGILFVRFYANYDDNWEEICHVTEAPYECRWDASAVSDQDVAFTLVVLDRAEHVLANPGGVRKVRLHRPPSQPSTPVVTSTTISSIGLSWEDTSTNEDGFHIYRTIDLQTWTRIDSVDADVTAFVNTGLPCYTGYAYRVTAYNSAGESPPTQFYFVDTQTELCPPPAFSATNIDFGEQGIGDTTTTKTITLTNRAATTMRIWEVELEGAHASEFGRTTTCIGELEARDTCTINVTFAPTKIGERTAELNIGSASEGYPHKIALRGIGQAGLPSLQYYPLPRPVRLLDTRAGFPACDTPGVPLAQNSTRVQTARTRCTGIPADAQAIVGNATVVNRTPESGEGYLTLYPSNAARPEVSNLNYVRDQIVPNAFTVGLDDQGRFSIFTTSRLDFLVDVTGYYAPPRSEGLYYYPLPRPVRLLDTRAGFPACDTPGTPLGQDTTRVQPARTACSGIPADAQAIVGNATVVNRTPESREGFLTLYPSDATRPEVSNLNYVKDQIIPNAFTVGLDDQGRFSIYTISRLNFLVDVTGYYSDRPTDANGRQGLRYQPLQQPVRLLDTRPDFPACDKPEEALEQDSTRVQAARTSCTGIPEDAQAIVGNATVVNRTATSREGYLTLYPSNTARPEVSNLNYLRGQIVPNAFTVGLDKEGRFSIFTISRLHFLVDIAGFFAP